MTQPVAAIVPSAAGLLGDTPARDYARKLSLFNSFAAPEMRRLIMGLGLRPGMRVLDAGCGTGEALNWLLDEVAPTGAVTGIDLAAAHVDAARLHTSPQIRILQGDLLDAHFSPASFDLIWCINTINHLRDPAQGVERLAVLLRPGGRIALGQSSLVPDMFFAWDSRLERVTNEAVRRYYRDRYCLEEHDLAAVRSIVGLLRRAQLHRVTARTVMIERVSPVNPADEAYLVEAIFRGTWGERLRPYLSSDDHAELTRLCDPQHAQFALHRPDFHFLQSFTLVTGEI
ncbi:MAG TPA: methyltransferase domain-containing protein [Steroidobacteraceae bacterium]|jgi:SAM-dependent methyltransferase